MSPALLIFLLACALLGYRVLSAVPPLLHTPLMSGMNALSGIVVLGALSVYTQAPSGASRSLAAVALFLAMVNVAGGFWVTERMRMFKHDTADEAKGGAQRCTH